MKKPEKFSFVDVRNLVSLGVTLGWVIPKEKKPVRTLEKIPAHVVNQLEEFANGRNWFTLKDFKAVLEKTTGHRSRTTVFKYLQQAVRQHMLIQKTNGMTAGRPGQPEKLYRQIPKRETKTPKVKL